MNPSETATFRQLRYFIAIAEQKSIRLAAEKLNISQPPLSRQLKELEASFGCELFVRGARGVTLTQEGEELYWRAQDIISRVRDAYQETRQIRAGTSGSLSIGYTDDFQYGAFPEALSRFRKANPDVHIRLEQDYTPRLGEMVDRGALDMAVLPPPFGPHLKEIASTNLGYVPIFALMPSDHRLAHKKSISIRELKDEVFVMAQLAPNNGYYIQLMNIFRRANISPNINMEIYPTAMIANFVAAGHGVCLITGDCLDPQRTDVARVRLSEDDAQLQRAIIWRRGFATRVARRFYEEFTGQVLPADA